MEHLVKQWVTKLQNGDQEVFENIIEMYKGTVYGICLRMVRIPQEAEDLAQETFIKAYTNIGTYKNTHKFSTWLYRIATNLSIDYLRKKKPGAYLDAELPGGDGYSLYSRLASSEETPEDQTIRQDDADLLRQKIEELPIKYRTAILLKYIDDLSIKEISDILDIPPATVKTRIHRGREALRKELRLSYRGD